ncbi:MAG: hemerythrin [Planctomycetota bacterium]|nr:MAG: hemerythrin [Planctomycetota bacterium]
MQACNDKRSKPTEVLSAEHRVIEQMLDCLERVAADGRVRAALCAEDARDCVEFLRTFADRCHHGKEEDVLFELLRARGMPTHVGPVAVMLGEHEEGRALVKRLDAAARSADARAAAVEFAAAADEYVALLRDHIAKEDGVLFPMAESVLRDEDRVEALRRYEARERDDLGAGTHERMLGLSERLAHKYGVKRASERAAPAFGGCCHH